LVLTGEAGDFVISLRLCVSAREYCFCGVGNYLSHGPEGWVLVAEKHKAIRNRIKEQILLKVPFAHFRVDRD